MTETNGRKPSNRKPGAPKGKPSDSKTFSLVKETTK